MTKFTQWYRNIALPQWGWEMECFISPSMGLLSKLLPGRANKLPVIFVDGVGTALADQINGRIVVDRCVFSPVPNERINPFANKELSLSFSLGAIMHEGGHFAYSPATLKDFFKAGTVMNSVNCNIANIIEDLYIENRIVKEVPEMAWTIFAIWEYLLDPRLVKGDVWDGVTVTNETLSLVLNQMISWKDQNRIFNFRSDFEAELYEAMYSVCGMNNLSDRRDLIARIIKMLKQEIKEQKQEEQEDKENGSESKNNQKSDSGKSSGKGSDKGEGKKEKQEKSEPEESEEGEEGEKSEASEEEEEVEDADGEEASEYDEEEDSEDFDDAEDSEDVEGEDGEDELTYLDIAEIVEGQYTPNGKIFKGVIPGGTSFSASSKMHGFEIDSVEVSNNVPLYIVEPKSIKGSKLNYDKNWERFAEIAKQRGAVRSVSGAAKMDGKKLSHPQNISNGRVFSTNRLDSTSGSIHKAPPQIVMMLDCSGSMNEREKFTKTMAAAYGASVGMMAAGISFAIYGYTTDYEGGVNSVLIYKIKDMQEKGDSALGRLSYMSRSTRDIYKNLTPDVEALDFGSKKFVNNGADRVMIVISDGTPYCERYVGPAKAKQKVEDIRKTGVRVFGLSIEKSADDSVKEIYGNDSLCDSDPNAISKFLAQFI